ncbi:MAG: hypothetical protein FJ388_08600 [Verrucomicrobia bacterium]|nr:hypothetical protein [Verrucomicrobiota bacterium]
MTRCPILYLDVDGVLQFVKGNRWMPRSDAGEFLDWAVRHFTCRWLTSWQRPNETLPRELGIRVPPGIEEVCWRKAEPFPPFKASAISDDEDWLWLEDEPSEFDLKDLRRRKKQDCLIRVNPLVPTVLLTGVQEELQERLRHRRTSIATRRLQDSQATGES